jgi:hypothetical protein
MFWRWLFVFLWASLAGCSTLRDSTADPSRPFEFHQDTFAYTNETVWEYVLDQETGRMHSQRRRSAPSYSHHCFAVARAARQFWQHARFEPREPPVERADYQRLVRQVRARNPRVKAPPAERVVIPGYPNLREFSRAHEPLLKKETGGPWESYFQRGNWRMVFPFSRRHQERMAAQLTAALEEGRPAIVHLVRFPSLAVNHALLLYEAETRGGKVLFSAYDPNDSSRPITLEFDSSGRRFFLAESAYFPGGRVDVYEVYRGVWY